jgi:hypothetical protein
MKIFCRPRTGRRSAAYQTKRAKSGANGSRSAMRRPDMVAIGTDPQPCPRFGCKRPSARHDSTSRRPFQCTARATVPPSTRGRANEGAASFFLRRLSSHCRSLVPLQSLMGEVGTGKASGTRTESARENSVTWLPGPLAKNEPLPAKHPADQLRIHSSPVEMTGSGVIIRVANRPAPNAARSHPGNLRGSRPRKSF